MATEAILNTWDLEYSLDGSIFIKEGENLIAVMQNDETDEETGFSEKMVKNAKLAAAAPQLYNALKVALSDPDKISDCAAAYSLTYILKYPVQVSMQAKADYYKKLIDALKAVL